MMHRLIVELQTYHRKKARHLFELETCISGLSENDSSDDYRDSLKVLFEPFQSATEIAHHHNEELILGELRRTSAPIHRRVEEISGDHDAFSRIVVEISTKLNDDSTSCAELCSTIRRFMEIYNDHAAGEESIFFPIADRYLQESHWQRIAKAWK